VAAIKDIVVDCARPSAVARFWAAVLDGYAVAPYDDAELARLRELGIDDVEDDPSVLVEPTSGRGPRFFFQVVPEPKTVKNRLHLDLSPVIGRDEELARITALGGTIEAVFDDHTLLLDVEGNEFCLLHRPAAVG
jgi:hypothetical protein